MCIASYIMLNLGIIEQLVLMINHLHIKHEEKTCNYIIGPACITLNAEDTDEFKLMEESFRS